MVTYLGVLPDEVQTGVDQPLKHVVEDLAALSLHHLAEGVDPGLDDGSPAQGGGFQVHHPTPTDGGGLKRGTGRLVHSHMLSAI